MFTSRISIAVPGTLEPNRIVRPSSGWIRITRALWVSSSVAARVNGRWGAGLKTTATSVTRRPRRLPVRR